MLNFCLLLAQIAPPDLPQAPVRSGSHSFRDVLLVVGAVAALALVLFLWAYLTRRNPRRKASGGARVLYHSDRQNDGKVKVRRKRSRHPDNLPRNPTLAEAGGLPPAREEPAEPAC